MVPMSEYTPIGELINLTNKRAVVTGGAMGIGFAISYRLAEAGASIVIVDIHSERAEKASEELRSYGYEASFIQADVSKEKEVQDMVNTIVGEVGVIDILVNNAGIYPFIPFSKITGDDIDKVLSVNLKGTLLCSRVRTAQYPRECHRSRKHHDRRHAITGRRAPAERMEGRTEEVYGQHCAGEAW
jgi:NAD(P)-dependent dehydrogenase (short-subunit alcohol dehydrogenase family)